MLTAQSSLVIDHLKKQLDDQSAIGYTYFDYRDQDFQSCCNVTASLLNQVAASGTSLPADVAEAYEKSKAEETSLVTKEAERLLVATCQDFRRVYTVIDALDECDGVRHRKELIRILGHLRQRPGVRLFVTSRSYPEDIKSAFVSASQITIRANEHDLKKFITDEIDSNDASDLIDEEFKANIIHKIVNGAQDM